MMMKIVNVIDAYENCLKQIDNDVLTPLTPSMKDFLQKRKTAAVDLFRQECECAGTCGAMPDIIEIGSLGCASFKLQKHVRDYAVCTLMLAAGAWPKNTAEARMLLKQFGVQESDADTVSKWTNAVSMAVNQMLSDCPLYPGSCLRGDGKNFSFNSNAAAGARRRGKYRSRKQRAGEK